MCTRRLTARFRWTDCTGFLITARRFPTGILSESNRLVAVLPFRTGWLFRANILSSVMARSKRSARLQSEEKPVGSRESARALYRREQLVLYGRLQERIAGPRAASRFGGPLLGLLLNSRRGDQEPGVAADYCRGQGSLRGSRILKHGASGTAREPGLVPCQAIRWICAERGTIDRRGYSEPRHVVARWQPFRRSQGAPMDLG